MDRRRFIGTLTGSLLAAPLAAEAQPTGKVYRIGVLYPGADNSIFRGNFDGFRQALGAAGYVAGRNLAFEVRFGDGQALAPLAADLTKLHPDLIDAVARPGYWRCTPQRLRFQSLRSTSRVTPSRRGS